MLRLNTFGGLVLQQDGQLHTGPASQRRRLALLAVAAVGGRRGVSRDKLLSLLWPDSEAEAARHSLYQAVHAIRRSAGSDEIFLGSATLQLNPQLITSDVGEFEDAIESGSHELAVRLYRGPFLDGFRLESAPEYEQWQDGERVRHAREYAAALESLAAGAAARGDHPAAVRWWRGDRAAERAHGDSARVLIERRLQPLPDDAKMLATLGLAYMHLGRHADAIRTGERAAERLRVEDDAVSGPFILACLARVYTTAGRYDQATAALQRLMATNAWFTPHALRTDPIWAPLRHYPGFRKLAEMENVPSYSARWPPATPASTPWSAASPAAGSRPTARWRSSPASRGTPAR